ncbi:hypothetical protein XA68_13757 [Ophiocordyceps unilateralis]|uniref:Uncharacterized protein n=1 Tax=Ophiocordyceps unilateralis TaxID=268505 RepID=A0A2A9PBR9_OPHUN|nr:hypothetical protein XA68_13757 [Ophiocordyceps unilateralis]
MDDSPLPFPDQPFARSRLFDPERIGETGAFTRLAARISTSDHLADPGTRRARDDFLAFVGQWQPHDPCASPIGNFNSFMYAECLPDRLEVLSYLNGLAFLHDDYTAQEGEESIASKHKRLEYALSPQETQSPDGSPLSSKMKRLYSEVILECCKLDTQPALDFVRSYSNHWLKVVDKQPMPASSLDDYFQERVGDGGTRTYWWMMAFAHGTRMTEEEFTMIEPLIFAAERVYIATNDFFSWNKERVEPLYRIWNAVLVFMRTQALSEHDAVARLKQFIIDEEQRFLDEQRRFCALHYDIPPHLKRIVNAIAPAIGGFHIWCSVCPRYRKWKETPASPLQLPLSIKEPNGTSTARHPTTTCLFPESVNQGSGPHDQDDLSNDTLVRQASSILHAPALYIRSLTSKNVRSQLIDAFNLWLDQPGEILAAIKKTIDDLHHSSLILDDIQDRSPLRRGKIATHHIFGEAQTINSATYLFVEATKTIHRLKNPTMTSVLLEELENLFLGQALDLNWKVTMQCPSKEEYLAMVDRKTGSMFRLIVRLLTAATDKTRPHMAMFDRLARLLGQWYQVRDDYMNLKGSGYSKEKGFCEDLDEGKFSYPILCCCASDAFARDVILGILRQRASSTAQTAPPESKLQILEVMKQSGAFAETFSLLRMLQMEVEAEIGALEELRHETNPMLRLLVLTLSDIPEP